MLCRTAIRVGDHVFKLCYVVGSVSDPVKWKGKDFSSKIRQIWVLIQL